jgi:hypothetical protein
MLIVVTAFVIGHAVAQIADWIVMQLIVDRWLKKPQEWLLLMNRPGEKKRRIPYQKPVRDEFNSRLEAAVTAVCGEQHELDANDYFGTAYSVVILNSSSRERLNIFLTLYSFSRNTSVAFALSALFVNPFFLYEDLLKPGSNPTWTPFVWLVALSVLFFFRFLRFYRHYTKLVLLVFEFFVELTRLRTGGTILAS